MRVLWRFAIERAPAFFDGRSARGKEIVAFHARANLGIVLHAIGHMHGDEAAADQIENGSFIAREGRCGVARGNDGVMVRDLRVVINALCTRQRLFEHGLRERLERRGNRAERRWNLGRHTLGNTRLSVRG